MDTANAQNPFIGNFKELWAVNGDNISYLYAGTASSTATLTKTGQGGFLHIVEKGVIGLERMY